MIRKPSTPSGPYTHICPYCGQDFPTPIDTPKDSYWRHLRFYCEQFGAGTDIPYKPYKPREQKEYPHGTPNKYRQGCRCDGCKTAARREWARRQNKHRMGP